MKFENTFPIQKLPKAWFAIIIICVLVFVSFVIINVIIGGDALNGKIENGHFYVRQGVLYKEVSFGEYLVSAFSCLSVSVAFFLIGNRVLYALEIACILQSTPTLRTWLNIFGGMVCGWIAVYSLIVIWHALTVPHGLK